MANGRKTGGRVAGTPNKATATMRNAIVGFLDEYFSPDGTFKTDLAELDPKDRLTLVEKFTAYAVPKLQATTLDVMSEDKKQTIEDKLMKLSEDKK